jgi:two-component system OmpR family sensor kinase
VRRNLALTGLFALAVVAVVAAASWFAYVRVRDALEDEFARRVEWVAAAGAADVTPAQVARLRAEGRGAFALADSLLLSLGGVRRSSQAARVFLVHADGTLLLDTEGDSFVGDPATLSANDHAALAAALAGGAAHGPLVERSGRRALTGFAPVRDPGAGGAAVAALGVEASAEFLAVLPEVARLLVVSALLAAASVIVLAALFVRLLAAQHALERSLSRAENLASVGELAATLAHEVRNPLGVIQGAAQRLRRHYAGPEPELFDYVDAEVTRLTRTVQHYLAFARPSEPGEGGVVGEALEATLGLLAREAERQGVTLLVEPGVSGVQPARVTMGGEELKQASFNLVRNALEALPGGGTIRVGWGDAGARRVALWVSDDGPGMDAATLARARRPFVTTRAQGTGLGLAIVDRLARDAGGRLELVSAPGKGTTARLELPRAAGPRGEGGA